MGECHRNSAGVYSNLPGRDLDLKLQGTLHLRVPSPMFMHVETISSTICFNWFPIIHASLYLCYQLNSLFKPSWQPSSEVKVEKCISCLCLPYPFFSIFTLPPQRRFAPCTCS